MPGFVSEWISGLKTPSRKESAAYAYLIEALDIIAAIIFVLGSICFLPRFSKNTEIFICGCNSFVVGSVQYVVISLLTLAEALSYKGAWTFEALENMGWLTGSVVFLVGTILYFPERDFCKLAVSGNFTGDAGSEQCHSLSQHMNKHSKAFYGTILFISGSMIFVMAIFINALSQRKFGKWHHRMISIITFNYMLGSLLFCMGSIAFLPDVGCGPEMVTLGAWMFIIGSGFFVIGSVLSCRRTHYMLNDDTDSSEDSQREIESKKPLDVM